MVDGHHSSVRTIGNVVDNKSQLLMFTRKRTMQRSQKIKRSKGTGSDEKFN